VRKYVGVKRHKRPDLDFWAVSARNDGLRTRAAYKLEQINEKFRILTKGNAVLDLGASPGGWTLVSTVQIHPSPTIPWTLFERLTKEAGEYKTTYLLPAKRGFVIAVDRSDMEPVPGATFIQGDILAPDTHAKIAAILRDRCVDVVLSDMAPNTTGVAWSDHVASMELSTQALEIASKYLVKNGSFVVKFFPGSEDKNLVRQAKKLFSKVSLFKPEASRKDANELFLIGKGFKKLTPPTNPDTQADKVKEPQSGPQHAGSPEDKVDGA